MAHSGRAGQARVGALVAFHDLRHFTESPVPTMLRGVSASVHGAHTRLVVPAVSLAAVLVASLALASCSSGPGESVRASASPSSQLPVATASPSDTAGSQTIAPTPRPPSWTSSGQMTVARMEHVAVLLPDGRVLAVGGRSAESGPVLASAEIYDPVTAGWTPTGSMTNARFGHLGLLLGSGKVLVIGGWPRPDSDAYDPVLKRAELYDPVAGTWKRTGDTRGTHALGTATLLANGRVLVAGGDVGGPADNSEIYDPQTGTWRSGGQMRMVRQEHTATLLADGRVLVAGGHAEPSGGGRVDAVKTAEIYDPRTGKWTATGSMATARAGHVAARLPDGRVLVAGGSLSLDGEVLASAEIFDPTTGAWSAASSMAATRYGAGAAVLADGRVLVASGTSDITTLVAFSEIYDPATGAWSAGAPVSGRLWDTLTPLADGRHVLAVGGGGYVGETPTAVSFTALFDAGG